jgi:hypothetical protein
MNNISILFIAALSFAACKKSGDAGAGSGSAAAATGGDCTKAIAHSMELSKPMMAKMGVPEATMQKMQDVGVQHCNDDKWPAEAIKCMGEATTMEAGQGCYSKLSTDQQQKMNADAMKLAAAAAGSTPPAPATGSAMGSGSGSAK